MGFLYLHINIHWTFIYSSIPWDHMEDFGTDISISFNLGACQLHVYTCNTDLFENYVLNNMHELATITLYAVVWMGWMLDSRLRHRSFKVIIRKCLTTAVNGGKWHVFENVPYHIESWTQANIDVMHRSCFGK